MVNSYDKKRSTRDHGSYSRSRGKRARSRSRSRSRSPARGRRDGSDYNYNSSSSKRQRKSSKAKKSGSGVSSSGKSEKKSHNKKGTIPTSFSEAWNTYLSPLAILMVTAVGLVVETIPNLHEMPLGGRLSASKIGEKSCLMTGFLTLLSLDILFHSNTCPYNTKFHVIPLQLAKPTKSW